MKTVKDVSKVTGVSVRTLHHYDAIGLLKPSQVTDAGYRLYDDAALERLYMILVFREIGFRLKDIQAVLDAPDFDRNRVLERQILLLQDKVTHLQNRIHLAQGIKLIGVKHLEFEGFDAKKFDELSAQAQAIWGKTDAYKEYQQKSKGRTKAGADALNGQVMDFFVRLGALRQEPPESEAVQAWVGELQAFFTDNFYTCTPQILRGLGELYAAGGSMTENIDKAGGAGTAEFAHRAIDIYTK